LASFLNCNKVKKLGVTTAKQIIEAVENTENLELNADKTALRVKCLETLPEFKPKKKVKSEEKPKENANPYENLEVYSKSYAGSSSVFLLKRNRPSLSDTSRRLC
jgi:hypothetical protein